MSTIAVLFRIVVTVVFLGILLRMAGKRGWLQARPFDLIMAFVLGNLGHDLILGRVSLPEALTGMGVLVWLHLAITTLTQRSRLLHRITWGQPVVLIQHGVVQRQAVRSAGIDAAQLTSLLHRHGIERIGDVRELRLETDGSPVLMRSTPARPLKQCDLPVSSQSEEERPWLRAA